MKNKIDQYTDTDDEKLFALIEQGDEGAFTQAYERYHKLLYVLAYRYPGTNHVHKEPDAYRHH